jgi:hypothetical protein
MPYIDQERRDLLNPSIDELQNELKSLGLKEGDLNYAITRLIAFYFLNDIRYHSNARIQGVLKDAGKEFYRRVAALYEDQAKDTNGDVPEFEVILSKLKGEFDE